jgi:hypothetical protein
LASVAGTLTDTEPGNAAVVVVTPDVVWHTTNGSVAVTIGPELVVGVFDDTDVVDDSDAESLVVEVVVVALSCGWVAVVADDEPGPDEPHAASNSALPTRTPANPVRARWLTRTPPKATHRR